MTHSFPIIFEPRPIREGPDRPVSPDIVFTPVDGFTGRVVSGVSACIKAQSAWARRSASGHLFFERLYPADQHLVSFETGQSGYFSIPDRTIDMPQQRVLPTDSFASEAALNAALAADTRILRLVRRPEAVTDGEMLVVRGGVRRNAEWAEGVEVTGHVDGNPEVFRSLTNERGVFAIRLRPAPEMLDADALQIPRHVRVRLQFDGGNDWISDAPGGPGLLTDQKTHMINQPIDIP